MVTQPSMKSVGASGIGSGLQRIWLGEGATVEAGGDAGRASMRCEGAVHGRRADPVQPGAAVVAARGGEGGAGNLFGVQAVGHALRRVAVRGQGAGQGFGGEFVAEAAHVPWVKAVSWYLHVVFVTVEETQRILRDEYKNVDYSAHQ
jgi:hypothetical protein